ncbi:MAG: hypothetical protein H6Q66_1978 [Firmicutes bacterium]|nr:hypothetical protein [Bacillota bacterium]
MNFANKKLYEPLELLKQNGGPLPLSRSGIYHALKQGQIPSIHVGRRVFIPSWYIDNLLSPQSVQTM